MAALWAWLAAVGLISVLSWFSGGSLRAVAGAVALALAPALAGFILAPRLGEKPAARGFIATWLLMATGLAGGSGGAASPLVVTLMIAPVWYAMFGLSIVRGGVLAFVGYLGAAVVARLIETPEPLGLFPQLLAATSILFIAGLLMIHARRSETDPREESVTQRIAEVSHELRTPLTHILGFAEMIEKEVLGPAGPRNVEYAGLIRASGAHLLGLVNDLLDLSRIDAGRYDIDFETFDVRAIAEEVVRMSSDVARSKDIILLARLSEAPLMVHGDARAIRRMLINTIGNAVKFTPHGGLVTLDAHADGRDLVLDTIDSGPGIPVDERQRLGQPYERGAGAARAEGTGLGLSLVKGLAHLHQGTLSFHDAPGGGALVRIQAPIIASD